MNFQQYRDMQKEMVIDNHIVKYVSIGEGYPVLLIHGIPVWGFLWKDMITDLSKKFQLIIPDLIGYGYSDKRDCFDRSVTVQADILKKLIDKLNITQLHVVGHDIGGAVAQRFLVSNRKMVTKFVLIDAVVYDSWPADPMIKLSNPKLHHKTKNDELAKKFIERLPDGICNKQIITHELLEGWMAPYANEEGKLSLIRNASSLNTNHTMEIIEDLKKGNTPILIIWGEDDIFQPLEYAKKFVDEIPNSRLVVIPKAGHFLPFEKPAEIVSELIEFF